MAKAKKSADPGYVPGLNGFHGDASGGEPEAETKAGRWDWHSREGRSELDAAVRFALGMTPTSRADLGAKIGIAKDDVNGLRAVSASVWRSIEAGRWGVMWRGNGGQRVFWRETPSTRAVTK